MLFVVIGTSFGFSCIMSDIGYMGFNFMCVTIAKNFSEEETNIYFNVAKIFKLISKM